METTTTDILIAALLIIPTCAGLWFYDNEKPPVDDRMLEHLRERRIAQRRLGKPRKDDALVSHYLLKAGDDWQVISLHADQERVDRRGRDRRAEDSRRGSHGIAAPAIEADAGHSRGLSATNIDHSSSETPDSMRQERLLDALPAGSYPDNCP
jgi:hypothetical protein